MSTFKQTFMGYMAGWAVATLLTIGMRKAGVFDPVFDQLGEKIAEHLARGVETRSKVGR